MCIFAIQETPLMRYAQVGNILAFTLQLLMINFPKNDNPD